MLQSANTACPTTDYVYAAAAAVLTVILLIVVYFAGRRAEEREAENKREKSFNAIFNNIKSQIGKSQVLAQKGRHEQAIYDLREVIEKNLGTIISLFLSSCGPTPLLRILLGPPPRPQIKLCKAGDCTCEPDHWIRLEATGPHRENFPVLQVTPTPVKVLPTVRHSLRTSDQRKFQELVGDSTLFVDVHIEEPDPKRLFICECEKGKCQDIPKSCCDPKPFDRVNYPKEYPAWVDQALNEFDASWTQDKIINLLRAIHKQLTTTTAPVIHK